MSGVIRRELAKQKKMLHPNSRKIKAIARKSKKAITKEQAKRSGNTKQMLMRDKMIWMIENMVPNVCPYTPQLTGELLEKYISRHEKELQWIHQQNALPGRKNRSYSAREDVLRLMKERELDDYNGCGIEIPNILNSTQCEMLRKWDGDVRYLPNFVFRRFGKRHVNEMLAKQRKNLKPEENPTTEQATNNSSTMEDAVDINDEENDEGMCPTNKTGMDTE